MGKTINLLASCLVAGLALSSCSAHDAGSSAIDADQALAYCDTQIRRTLTLVQNDSCLLPRSIEADSQTWSLVNAYDWTSGFWPGILWYDYQHTGDPAIRQQAIHYTECLADLLSPGHQGDHDLGFQFLCSFVHAYRLTGDERYKQAALDGAAKLAGFYNPTVGTICSWQHMREQMGWPHNTIMDNMMNLELLFWAARNGGDKAYYDMAENHARVTMENQFRDDYTNYHVAVYDTIDGHFIKGVTNQGLNDESCWARGQAWAIYGYTMVYRETGNKEYLRFAERVADVYLTALPADHVPYWDFDAPDIPDEPKDASAAAITASGLLELSQLEDDKEKGRAYFQAAEQMLATLSTKPYRADGDKPSFLLHSTGNYPAGYEIDAAINYADYYYIEALTRYKTIREKANKP